MQEKSETKEMEPEKEVHADSTGMGAGSEEKNQKMKEAREALEEEAKKETGVEAEEKPEEKIEEEAEKEAEAKEKEEEAEKEEWEKEAPIFSMERRLTKSSTNKILAGVCGGIGEYFDIDPTIVRLAFVFLAFFNGMGIVIYVILAVIMPSEDSSKMTQMASGRDFRTTGERSPEASREIKSERTRLLGAVLLIIGIFLLLDRLHIFEMFWWMNKFFWPLTFLAAGAWLLLRNRQ